MKKLRVGVIGLGFIGPQHIDAIRRVPGAELAALCDASPQMLAAAAERYQAPKTYADWRALLADPEIDVIHNCTPNAMHDAVNEAAILSGKHVYCEKPLSQSAQGARRLCQLARERGVACGLNHQYRLNAAVQEMKARLANGLAGKPLFAWGCYLQESASRGTDWSRKMENTGVARTLNDIGIHWVDTACCALGQPLKAVMADLSTHYSERVGDDGVSHPVTTEDTGMILLRFANGVPGQLITSKAANGHKNDLRLSIACEGYGMEWRQEEPDRLRIGEKEIGEELVYMNPRTCQPEARPYVTLPMGHVMGWTDALHNAVQAFYDSIQDGSYLAERQPYATFRDGFAGMAFVEACIRSNREQGWVEVETL